MKHTRILLAAALVTAFVMGCDTNDGSPGFTQPRSTPQSFSEVGEIVLGGEGAAEITAYDPDSEQLFVVNNSGATKVDVVDISDVSSPQLVQSLDMTFYGGGVNSVAVKNGMLAVANENPSATAVGSVTIFDISDFTVLANVIVGSLPDMVTFTPDGNYILTANEGEPNDDYTIDPNGSISFINVNNNFNVFTTDFSSFNGDEASLEANGFRVFGPGADLAADVEPEYIAVSDDSRTAYVTLQENNGVAIVDIINQRIEAIVPLGLKDWTALGLSIDVSDEDGGIGNSSDVWPIVGMYQPDAIAYFTDNGFPYLITANEGDARDYDGFSEEERVDDLTLDAATFPNAADLQLEENLGRMKVTTANGDAEGDGDTDVIWTYGARSFSIWSALDGSLVWDSGTETEDQAVAAGVYPDNRSDDKGTEPEGVAVGVVGTTTYAFIGLERADAVVVYDISRPDLPIFKQLLNTGDAPEGVLFIGEADSPNGANLLVVSSEDDGTVKIYQLQ